MSDGKHAELTGRIIQAFYEVYNSLGYGFSEKVYENSLAIELRRLDFEAIQQSEIPVYYRGELVGKYASDIIVNGLVILELKATRTLADEHSAQLLNYLKATQIEVGLLLNFGPEAGIRRRIYDNSRKGSLGWISNRDTDSTD